MTAGQQQCLVGPSGPVRHHDQPVRVLHHQPLLQDTALDGDRHSPDALEMGAAGGPALGGCGASPGGRPAPKEGIRTKATSSPSVEPPAQHTPAAWARRAGSGAAAGSGPPGAPRWGGSCWPTPGRDTGARGWVTHTPHLEGCFHHAAHPQVHAAIRWRVRRAAATRDSPQEGR